MHMVPKCDADEMRVRLVTYFAYSAQYPHLFFAVHISLLFTYRFSRPILHLAAFVDDNHKNMSVCIRSIVFIRTRVKQNFGRYSLFALHANTSYKCLRV